MTLKLKWKRKAKMIGRPTQQLAKLEERIEGIIEEERSNKKAIIRKLAEKRTRVLRKDRISLSQIE